MGKFAENLQARLIGAKSCRSCEFVLKSEGKHHCRRYPPQTFVLPQITASGPALTPMSWYPPVNPDQPCGEYKRSEMRAGEELQEAAGAETRQ